MAHPDTEDGFVTYEITASSFTYYKHTVRVPAHITPDQINDHYRAIGANGEFEETSTDWNWDGVEKADEDDPDAELLTDLTA